MLIYQVSGVHIFTLGILSLAYQAIRSWILPNTNCLEIYGQRTKQEHDLLGAVVKAMRSLKVENPKWTTFKAVLMLLVGTLIAAAFADPLIDVVDNFSSATSIPTFFISFVALPLATSCEAVSAIMFASRKKKRTASLTFSQLYGSATMNNVLCLSQFPHCLPSLDVFDRFPTLPLLRGPHLCPGLRLWLVLD
ncbi:hypothetical protein Pyn_37198 [Prunus yedoensis var. nudiflora]|uniref:Sodium/calcium exchanger membrane region domain-containing protein n=1 Tax=Prunus yedoensis var. nudiflora TaxID=2094558 RepID=A0A314XN87_PRUYE|nr:hypothetical protein Pyn_37198 [Prunus yedoensis var. nudiflora]